MNVMLSVVALWNYDNTLFNSMVLPETVDRDVLIDSIFMEAGELCVLYPDVNLFKRFLGRWCERKLPQWERYLAVINAQYELTHNYDRTETETIERELSDDSTAHHTGTVGSSETTSSQVDHTGTDTIAQTGTQTMADEGTETLSKYGKETVAHGGTQAVAEGGTESLTHSGTDTRTIHDESRIDNFGTQTNAGNTTDTGTVQQAPQLTTTKAVNAYNSSTLVNSEQEQQTGTSTETRNLGGTSSTTRTDNLTQTDDKDGTDALAYGHVETKQGGLTSTRTDQLTDTTTFGGETAADDRQDVTDVDMIHRRTDDLETLNTKALRDTQSGTRTNTDTYNETQTTENDQAETTERTVRAYGNIGVTTAQEMLRQELDLIPSLDIYQVITDDFISAFCIGVY